MRSNRQGEIQAAFALVAAVIGAGFASGREIMRFFSVFGPWSWAGCVLAALLLAGFSAWAAALANRLHAYDLATLCLRALGGAGGRVAAWLNGTLVTVTAGAMIAAMGELAALSLPIQNAYAVGVACTLVVGVLLAYRGLSAIAAVGGWLLPTCLVLYFLLLRQDAPRAVLSVEPINAWRALPLSFAYAAMNAALGAGVLCELGVGRDTRGIVRTCALAGALLLLMLLLGNAVFIRHVDTLRDAALPVVMLSRSLGAAGYWLCIAVLSLAVMSTLVALLRTLERMTARFVPPRMSWPLAVLLPLLAGLTGFDTLIGGAYPLLGVASTLLFFGMIVKPLGMRAKNQEGRDLCACENARGGKAERIKSGSTPFAKM